MKIQEHDRTAVNLTKVSKVFGTGEQRVNAVTDISLSARSGELLLIMGPSGSG
jgi:putative ABC transport system ATP-binding protein